MNPDKSKGEEKEGGGKDVDLTRRNRGMKLNPLANAVTDQYVDDVSFYQPRIHRRDRYDFWKHLEALDLPPKKLIIDKDCWMAQELGVKNSFAAYPTVIRLATLFCISNFWDHLYLNLMLIWLILIILYVDGWAKDFFPFLITINAGNILILLPPLASFMTQLFPLLGTVVLMHSSYDCVHFYSMDNFQNWAISACLVSQYIEYFYYGGQNKVSQAGKCAIGHPPNYIPSWRVELYNHVNALADKYLPKRYAKIFMESASLSGKSFLSKSNNSGEESPDHAEQENNESDNDVEKGNSRKKESEKKSDENSGSNSSADSDEDDANDSDENSGGEEEEEDDDVTSSDNSNSGSDRSVSDNDDDESDEEGEDSNEEEEDEDDEEGQRRKFMEGQSIPDNTVVKAPGHLLQDILGENFQPKVVDPDSDEEDIEWVEWTCLVCAMENRRPETIENPGWSIAFGERGRFLKQTYAIMNENTSKPTCRKCFTPFDYQPPPGSAHLFPHNPEPFKAFENYPPEPKFSHGLNIEQEEFRFKYIEPIKNFLFGIRNDPKSKLLFNDWKLRKWIRDKMPEINRYKLKPGEMYQVGEIVECKVQKAEYCRARITAIRKNFTYDIRYDTGDELRFVHPNQLRLGFEKGAYAYRVELCMAILWSAFPAGLVFAISAGYDWLTYAYEMVFIAPLLISLCLLLFRVINFIQYVVNFKNAGCWVIFKSSVLFILPLFFLMLTGAVGLVQGRDPETWGGIIALLVLTKVFSLPILYAIRPVYAVIGSAVFLLSTIGLILLSVYMGAKIQEVKDGKPDPFIPTDDFNGGVGERNPYPPKPITEEYIAVAIVPWIFLVLLLKYVRYHLHAIWDTCLVIRPATKRWKSNPILYVTCMNWKDECFQTISSLFERDGS